MLINNKMLNLNIQVRDEIVRVLQGQIVPAQSGAVLMQIANILSNLKPVAEAEKPVEPVKPETAAEDTKSPDEVNADRNV
jgi:hypothetical protein